MKDRNLNQQINNFETSAISYGFEDAARTSLREQRRDKAIEDAKVIRTGRRALALLVASGALMVGVGHKQIGHEVNTILENGSSSPALTSQAHEGERTAQETELANAVNAYQTQVAEGQTLTQHPNISNETQP